MGVASGCGEQEVGVASESGWNLWVWLLCVVVRRYIDFLILLIPTPLVFVLFVAASLLFVHFVKCFSFLFQYFFVIKFYVLNNFFGGSKNIPATTGVPRQPYEGCTYCFIHEEAPTNVRFISCYEHQLYERGVDLEVEGVRYIEIHFGPAAYVLGPPSSGGRDMELEGGVNSCHVEYVYESRDSHVRGTE